MNDGNECAEHNVYKGFVVGLEANHESVLFDLLLDILLFLFIFFVNLVGVLLLFEFLLGHLFLPTSRFRFFNRNLFGFSLRFFERGRSRNWDSRLLYKC